MNSNINDQLNRVADSFGEILETISSAQESLSQFTDNLGEFLTTIQSAVDNNVFGQNLPLLGDRLRDSTDEAVKFLDSLNLDVLEGVLNEVISEPSNLIREALVDALPELTDIEQVSEDISKSLLNTLLDPPQGSNSSEVLQEAIENSLEELGILDSGQALADELLGEILTQLQNQLDEPLTGLLNQVENPTNLITQALEQALGDDIEIANVTNDGFTFNLNRSAGNSLQTSLASDIGLPGLGLTTDGDATVDLGFDLDFSFGYTQSDGLFLDTSAEDELSLDLDASLPGLAANGKMGFLQLDITDNGSQLESGFSLDLQDADGKLTLSELSADNFDNLLNVTPTGSSDIKLNLLTSLDSAAILPKFGFDLNINWDFLQADATPSVSFDNTTVYFDSFLDNFLAPVLTRVNQITDPIQPINEVLNKNIGFLASITGRDRVTLLDLIEIGGQVAGVESVAQFSNTLSTIALLNRLTENASDARDFGINLGSVQLSDLDLFDANAATSEANLSASQVLPQNSSNSTYQSFLNLNAGEFGLSFPILDNPTSAVNLLLGQNIDLLKFDLPSLSLEAGIDRDFSIVGPIVANLEGLIKAQIDLGFGFDTHGLAQWANNDFNSDRLDLIFDGFYADDNRTVVNGQIVDLPEAELTGEISASGGLSIGIAGAYVGGGLSASLFADLEDEGEQGSDLGESDGKVRGAYIADLIDAGDIGCLFNFGGQFDAFLQAKARVLFKTWRKKFAKVTLAKFELDPCPDGVPILANEGTEIDGNPTQNPDLWLNMGSRANQRQFGNITDGAEIFTVQGTGATSNETVTVKAFGYEQNYQGVNKIYANGGAEDDTILTTIETVNNDGEVIGTTDTIAVPVEFAGGDGNDWLQGGLADDLLQGDEGSDLLEGRGGNDRLEGGEGDDQLEGGEGNDRLLGGKGEDLLEGGEGNDRLEGNSGGDSLFGEAGNDELFGGLDNDSLNGGIGADTLQGEEGDDYLFGEAGNDRLVGNAGNDSISGGDDTDTVSYLDAPDGVVVNINEGQDYENSANSATLEPEFAIGAGTARDGFGTTDSFKFTVTQTTFDNTGAIASQEDVVISGSLENIIGSNFADVLIGNEQNNRIEGMAGDDLIVSTAGDDRFDGGEDTDTVSYSRDPEPVYVNLDEQNGYQNVGGYLHETIVSDHLIPTDTEPDFTLNSGTALDGFGHTDILRNLENLIGSAYDDVLIGNARNNHIQSLAGDDLLVGNAGDDTLDGGDDKDTVSYRRDPDAVRVDLERDRAEDGFGNTDQLHDIENVVGSAFDDEIIGNNVANIVHAGAGDDRVEAREGDDILFGEAGKDIIWGEEGNDFLVGGTEADTLDGGEGNDTASYFTADAGVIASLTTGRGWLSDAQGDEFYGIENLEGSEYADRLIGDLGKNILSGLGGDDFLDGRAGDDFIDGGTGNDRLIGFVGDDQLYGQAGDDVLDGGEGNDGLYGGRGDDDLKGREGNDLLDGEEGNDALLGGEGADTLLGRAGDDALDGGEGNDLLDSGEGNDYLHGAEGDDRMLGGSGSDYLEGGIGNDALDGGAGNDIIDGGEGIDTVIYEESPDGVIVNLDSVNGYSSSGSSSNLVPAFTIAANTAVDGFGTTDTLQGENLENIKGSGFDDLLIGNARDNRIQGLAGNDVVVSTSGSDNLDGGSGTDTVSYRFSTSAVTVDLQQNTATDDFGNIDTVRNFENAIGSDFDDVLISNDNGNTLLGRDGNDTLAGGLGDDVIEGGTGDDLLRGELNDRTPQGAIKGGDDLIRGGVGNDLIGGKAGNDRLFGDEGEDRIWGDDGDDLLFGGLDNDILTGDDSSGGQGSDTFVLAIGHGTDTITDFEVGTDLIGLVGDLTFGQLSVTQIDNATQIAFGDEVLAVLDRVEVGTLTESSFTSNTNWI